MTRDCLWILSGQSNTVGPAIGTTPLVNPAVQMRSGGAWVTATEPLSCFDYTGCAGPIGWALVAGHAYAYWQLGATVKLAGWAKPSTPISAWAPGGAAWLGLQTAIVDAGAADASAFIWWQGEADAVAGTNATDYGTALESLIARVRTLTRWDLPVMLIGLADAPAGAELGYWTIRQTQREVAARTCAAFLSSEGIPIDGYHLFASGYRVIGMQVAARFARNPS